MSAKYLIFYLLILQISLLPKINNSFISYFSYITMKVHKTGNISVLDKNFRPFPDELFINEVNQSIIQYYFYFRSIENTINFLISN